jgi:hypothetical protein
MKPLYLVLLVLILCLVFILGDRYQIVTGPNGSLKIDTLTGQVWRYEEAPFCRTTILACSYTLAPDICWYLAVPYH